MAEKCPACGSCGMPMEKPEDFALGDTTRPYCRYCTDSRGELLPYEKVLETNPAPQLRQWVEGLKAQAR